MRNEMSSLSRLSHTIPMDQSNLSSGQASRIERRLIRTRGSCEYPRSIRLAIFGRQSKPPRYSTASW